MSWFIYVCCIIPAIGTEWSKKDTEKQNEIQAGPFSLTS